MNTEQYPVGQDVGLRIATLPDAVWQPAPSQPASPHPAPAVTLYPVPVPGAVQVQLPDGRLAWGRPVEHRLDPVPADAPRCEPVPALAKAVGVVAGSLTALALGGALALRIAAPALGDLVDLLDAIWKVVLTLAVILLGIGVVARRLLTRDHGTPDDGAAGGTDAGQTLVFAPQIDTGGTRLLGRGGDVNIQWGHGNHNKQ
ncbi:MULTISPECIES: hypothetical protein [Streptomyces]|uniref:Uncharacterized protein n=3 Tax=Streptomyces rimosus TaxID=1927 RepID=L8F0W6_STRR1|nr:MULTISPECIES: hypothetical protein [Streptomyces]MYT42029.1 hypothetical protein [Streptomyces sp. SID5471]KEF04883.1 hypothetical protein DF17_21830 [Streptomyces rimosus]KUJ35172.1 hypothetical protein ADK46_17150 [Streptomyces rimosus subsp. rimosus]QDA10285.1 hypothetical protein CTZ40_41650 [Streptomyces rimosus]QGY70873.1 hypothetical protein V519_037770 [Streptomyces rimosus R6-500]